MNVTRPEGLELINADLGRETMSTVCIEGNRILALGKSPRSGNRVIDLCGARVLPGLINAHDHLQWNHFPPLEYAEPYRNASQWIADINLRVQLDQWPGANVAASRTSRLFAGGIKNLLSGVTTVAHHDPLYPGLSRSDFPVRVVTHYGWSHSLPVDGEEKVRRSYEQTRPDHPWIIHAAEGFDEASAQEFERLAALGCLGPNSLIVHGVALDRDQRARLARAGAGLIWCPSSNLRLFGRTVDIRELLAAGRVALGTDSRLTGSRDLLEELRAATTLSGADEKTLEALVTRDNARMLRLADRGEVREGALADLLVLPRAMPLSRATRADVLLVIVDGLARYGDKQYAEACAPTAHWTEILVDGRSKVLDGHLAARLFSTEHEEPGVELPGAKWRAA